MEVANELDPTRALGGGPLASADPAKKKKKPKKKKKKPAQSDQVRCEFAPRSSQDHVDARSCACTRTAVEIARRLGLESKLWHDAPACASLESSSLFLCQLL